MANESCPAPSGTVIWFGSPEFRATSNGYDLELLPPRTDPDAPALQPRRWRQSGQRARQACMEWCRAARLSSPTWIVASVPQPGSTAENTTSSPPKATATLTEGDTSRTLLHPYGMRTPTATYASSVSTDMSAYEDLPGITCSQSATSSRRHLAAHASIPLMKSLSPRNVA